MRHPQPASGTKSLPCSPLLEWQNATIHSDRSRDCISQFVSSFRHCGIDSHSPGRKVLPQDSGEVATQKVARSHLFFIFCFVLPLVPCFGVLPALNPLPRFRFLVCSVHGLHRRLVCSGESRGHSVTHHRFGLAGN
jgi:hypothetical protein